MTYLLALVALVGLAASEPDELSAARDSLAAAIEKADEEKAVDAVQALKRIGTREAVQVLTKAFDQAGRAAARVEAEIDQLQKSVGDAAKPPAEYKVKMKEFADRLVALQGARAAAGRAFPEMRGPEVMEEFIRRVSGGGDGELRAWMAVALASSGNAQALAALLDRLTNEKDPRVVVAVLGGLAVKGTKDAAIVSQICAKLKDPAWPVVVSAAAALARIKSHDAVEPLIEALKASEGRVKADLNAALGTLTGVDKHGDFAAWKDWWERHREAFLAGTYKPEPAERAGGGPGGTTFYGLPVVSRRPVFVIDASMSMKQPSLWKPADDATAPGGIRLAGDRKIDVAQYELKKVLMMLPDGVEFNIVFFHRDVDTFSLWMVRLDAESRRRAIAWIDALQLVFQTNIYEGMRRAFSFGAPASSRPAGPRDTVVAGTDTIYLLSDGQPTTGIKDTDEFCRAIAELNRLRKIVLHTVAIEPTAASGKFMKRIAGENGGQYAARGEKKKKAP